MTKYIFKPKDFKAFTVDGLDARMEALNERIRPQLNELGDYFAQYLETVEIPKKYRKDFEAGETIKEVYLIKL